MITLQVETHSGKNFTVDVESYDPVSLNAQINDRELITLAIGNVILARIDIKFVAKVESN